MKRFPTNKKVGFIALIAAAGLGILILKSGIFSGDQVNAAAGQDLKIIKSQITSKARFYPVSAGGVNMEVIAVKASDGTVRTAFNTCQVCFDSGRGFYTQQGDELVCNNCGNRFKIDQIEKIKFGCNPIPILKENKSDDGNTVTIPKDFLAENARFFKNWKK